MSIKSIFVSQAESGKVAVVLRWGLGYDVQPSDCKGYVMNIVNRLEPHGGKAADVLQAAIRDALENDEGPSWRDALKERELFSLGLEPEEDPVYVRGLEENVYGY